jgi:hypothetical protein
MGEEMKARFPIAGIIKLVLRHSVFGRYITFEIQKKKSILGYFGIF